MKIQCLLPLLSMISYLQGASIVNLQFSLNDDRNSYSIIDCNELASGSLEIPSVFNDLPITSIGNNELSVVMT